MRLTFVSGTFAGDRNVLEIGASAAQAAQRLGAQVAAIESASLQPSLRPRCVDQLISELAELKGDDDLALLGAPAVAGSKTSSSTEDAKAVEAAFTARLSQLGEF